MQDPYDILKQYQQRGPVHEVVWAHGAKVWLVTGYDEVRALANDPRVSKDGRSDPPRHTRLRALVSKAFTGQRVERLRPRIEQVVDRLLDAMAGRPELPVQLSPNGGAE
jgi:pikromycin synthase